MYPYIGITDFTNYDQVQKMLKVFHAHLPSGSKRKLHVGVMMSYKTLNNIPSKWQNVFPPKQRIARIFSSEETYNCLHYADYENHHDLAENLTDAISYCGNGADAIQLDMTWPAPKQIDRFVATAGKKLEVILQIGKHALAEVNNNPQAVAERLESYRGVIDRVLLDSSMGKGLAMDAENLIQFTAIIRSTFPNLGIVAAGGLGPDTINLVSPLARQIPDLSIDAQGRLRPSGSNLDPIDWDIAAAYLIKALKILA